MNIVIHHNPECGTSRNVLAIIEAAGYRPTVIDYLTTGWTRPQLLGLFAAADLTPRTALRETKSPAADLRLLDPGVSEEALIEAMITHQALDLYVPVQRLDVSIRRRKGERLIQLDWHPLFRLAEPPACEWGLGLSRARLVCDEKLHLTEVEGQVPCTSCGKAWCRACHPASCSHCKQSGQRCELRH